MEAMGQVLVRFETWKAVAKIEISNLDGIFRFGTKMRSQDKALKLKIKFQKNQMGGRMVDLSHQTEIFNYWLETR